MSPIILALCSNVSFATASLYYTDFSSRFSAAWMNYYKALVAFVCFLAVTLIFNLASELFGHSALFLCTSGILGLLIGDIFLLKAFTHLGSGRVLMLFGFQPLILGLSSYFLFGQNFPPLRLFAVLLLMGCLLSFSFEAFRQKGHWDMKGLSFALFGVGLDAAGILLTKAAFEDSPNLSPFYANTFRSGATVVGFLVISQFSWFKLSLLAPLKKMDSRQKVLITGASFLGTFLSLGFYLSALKTGHLATVTAVAGTSPLIATLFETITGRKKMTPYLLLGIGFFVSGLLVLSFV